MTNFAPKILSVAIASVLLIGCGGGSDSGSSNSLVVPSQKDDAKVIEVVGDPIDIEVKDDLVIDPNANSDDELTDIPSEEISRAVLERLNSRRDKCGFGTLKVSKKLTDVAENHAKYLMYMSRYSTEQFQGHSEIYKDIYSGSKNPYYTGKYLQDRVSTNAQKGAQATAVDYSFSALGENLSFLSYNQAYAKSVSGKDIALNSINGLLAAPYHLSSLVSPNFSEVGISYEAGSIKRKIQLSNGSTEPGIGSVLEMVSARPLSQSVPKVTNIVSYPCNRVMDTAYELTDESPNPFKGTARNLREEPIGQPVYILAPGDIVVSNYKIVDAAGNQIPVKQLNNANDPNKILKTNEVVLMPLKPLQPGNMYTVSYRATVDNGATQNKSFWFKTRAK